MSTHAARPNPALSSVDHVDGSDKCGISPITEADLDALIASQRRFIRTYLAFALVMLSLGIGMVLVIILVFGQALPDALKSLLGVGCGFISSLSALQVKEMLRCRDKEILLLRLKERLQACDDAERQRIEKLVQEAVQKTILG
jgi:hypothetical protein